MWCGARKESRTRKKTVMLSKPCRDCALPLHENPPPYGYLRNHTRGQNTVAHNRRALTNRQCKRCFSRQAPAWYGALLCVSRDHYRAHPILFIVVRRLALTSVYKIPWHLSAEQELRMGRVALFIGEFHCRKFKFPGCASKEEYSPEA